MLRSIASGLADPVADQDLAESPELSDRACRDGRALYRGSLLEHRDGGHLALEIATEAQSITHADGPREHSDVCDLLAARAAFDLENRPGYRAVGISLRCRQQLRQAGHQWLHARTRDRGPTEDGVHHCSLRLSRELLAKLLIGDTRLVLDVRRQDPARRAPRASRPARPGTGVLGAGEREGRGARAKLARCSHRHDRRRQTFGDLPQHTLVVGPRRGRSC